MYGHEWLGWHGFVMPWMIIVPMMVICIVFLMRGRGMCHRVSRGDEAIEMARMRFAKGEIDAEEFETIKQKLSEV